MANKFNTNKKELLSSIAKSKEELKLYSLSSDRLKRFETLSLNIFKEYSTALNEHQNIIKNLVNLKKLEERIVSLVNSYSDTLTRLLLPESFSLTLVCKIQKNIPYIKGRVYWDNKQREVQIGSMKSVYSKVNELIDAGLIEPIDCLKKDISWEEIKNNDELKEAIKYLGKIKFKDYLLKHFIFSKPSFSPFEIIKKSTNKYASNTSKKDYNNNSINEQDWYKLWRKENL